MKPFTYARARSPAEAAASAANTAGARFIAGGTNLLDLMKLQVETPSHLIDVNGLSLDRIEPTTDGGLRIGALVRNTDLAADPRVRRDYAVLTRAIAGRSQSASCATRRPPPATCCSAPAARTSTTPTSLQQTRGRARAARPSAAFSRGLAVIGASEHCIATYPGRHGGGHARAGRPGGDGRAAGGDPRHIRSRSSTACRDTPQIETTLCAAS